MGRYTAWMNYKWYAITFFNNEIHSRCGYIRYFCITGIILCVLGNIQCSCRVILSTFCSIQICRIGIVINWQNHYNYMLAINASLLHCEEPSAATIVFDVKYAISPLNSGLVLFIISCCLYSIQIETCNIYFWKIDANYLQALIMKYECFTCLFTYITTI